MRLKSTELQSEFDEIGVIKIPKFLQKDALEEIKELYNELGLIDLKHTYTNVKDKSAEFNNKVNQIITGLSKESIANHFMDYQISGGAFLIKGIGEESHAMLHQDWNVVDESKFQSAVIFCAIHDIDERNGCIQVLKGSYKWFNNIRGLNNPSPIMEFSKAKKGLISFPLKAGDAIVFRHSVIHGSKPNFTNQNRIATMVSIASKDADYINYVKEENEFKVLKVSANFFNQDFSRLWSNKSIDEIVLDRFKIKDGMSLVASDYLEAYNNRYPLSTLDKVKKMFNR